MPVICLVRHGQASFGAEDYDELSDVGRAQSEVVGRELGRRGLRSPVVVHGTLRRQRDTAALAVAAGRLTAEVRVDGRWDEYDHVELVQRYAPADMTTDGSSRGVQDVLDAALRAWVEAGDDGGWPAFSGGASSALRELADGLGSGRDAVVFTSGGILAAVCSRLLGLAPEGVVALNRVTANAAITKLVSGRSGTSLLTFNDHAHFEGETRGLLTYR